MNYPNFNEENKLKKQGYKLVAGLDEAGRGPLAGPVVASVVLVKELKDKKMFLGIRDSKKLSQKQREQYYELLTTSKDIQWAVGIVSEKVIDKINILEATKLAMNKAIDDLNTKVDHLILDGNFKINSDIKQKSVIKGDNKVFSCCAAGIIAKVTRDRMMQKYHKKYPDYGFNTHKGYGTKFHIQKIGELGPCKIHRKTFYPVSRFV